jgi:hypothetical protein
LRLLNPSFHHSSIPVFQIAEFFVPQDQFGGAKFYKSTGFTIPALADQESSTWGGGQET